MLSNNAKSLFAIIVKLGLGAVYYILLRDLLTTESPDARGIVSPFTSVWFMTFVMSLFLLICALPLLPMEIRAFYRQQQTAASAPGSHRYDLPALCLSIIPATLDVIALRMSFDASLCLSPTVVVLLKASRTIFTAGLTSLITRKPQTLYNWVGIVITTIGVAVIALETVLSQRSDEENRNAAGKAALALILTLSAEMCWAIRFVYEERLIKVNHISAQTLVIVESFFAAVIAFVVWLTATWIGLESIENTLSQVKNSSTIQTLLLIVVMASGVSNVAAVFITKYLTSVHNALSSQFRVVFVFIPQVIRYKVDEHERPNATDRPGEKLNWYSLIKIAGFIVIFIGAMVYNGTLKLPLRALYPVEADKQNAVSKELNDTEVPLTANGI